MEYCNKLCKLEELKYKRNRLYEKITVKLDCVNEKCEAFVFEINFMHFNLWLISLESVFNTLKKINFTSKTKQKNNNEKC